MSILVNHKKKFNFEGFDRGSVVSGKSSSIDDSDSGKPISRIHSQDTMSADIKNIDDEIQNIDNEIQNLDLENPEVS